MERGANKGAFEPSEGFFKAMYPHQVLIVMQIMQSVSKSSVKFVKKTR